MQHTEYQEFKEFNFGQTMSKTCPKKSKTDSKRVEELVFDEVSEQYVPVIDAREKVLKIINHFNYWKFFLQKFLPFGLMIWMGVVLVKAVPEAATLVAPIVAEAIYWGIKVIAMIIAAIIIWWYGISLILQIDLPTRGEKPPPTTSTSTNYPAKTGQATYNIQNNYYHG